MARRHVELVRRFRDADNFMEVSTVRLAGDAEFDAGEQYRIHRQPFPFQEANRFSNQLHWARWLTGFSRDTVDVLHCGNVRPAGYAVNWASTRLRVPYMLYVYGGDLLRERKKVAASTLKRVTAKRIFGGATGITAISTWVGELAGEVMAEAGVKNMPPVGVFDLGTDPEMFRPDRDTGQLRAKWGVGEAPLVLTVARLVPHKGQDTGIRAIASLRNEFADVRYVLAGTGHDDKRLRDLAAELGVAEQVIFAGGLTDDELAEAYATSTVYLGASRVDNDINAEGFGISFVEASASGLPVVAGDSGGVRSAVRDGETGVIVRPRDVRAVTEAIAGFLRDHSRRATFGAAGRRAVETHYNWDRVARDTRDFTRTVVGHSAKGK
ncbi:MAG TPA: glycosyltransferase family 4 protein [Gemmatimonadaceae bacterium]|nr:glycosyltransferase family 4 protein [Gemmatimonadaceae bacterium]